MTRTITFRPLVPSHSADSGAPLPGLDAEVTEAIHLLAALALPVTPRGDCPVPAFRRRIIRYLNTPIGPGPADRDLLPPVDPHRLRLRIDRLWNLALAAPDLGATHIRWEPTAPAAAPDVRGGRP